MRPVQGLAPVQGPGPVQGLGPVAARWIASGQHPYPAARRSGHEQLWGESTAVTRLAPDQEATALSRRAFAWRRGGRAEACPTPWRIGLAACFTPRMITGLCAVVGMVIGTLLVARRARRTATQAEAGEAVFFQVGANLPDEGRRYSPGRVRAGGKFQWKPRWSWTRLRELPGDLRYIRARQATFRETLRLPTRALVIECESSDGPVRLWAHPEQAVHVVELIRRTSASNLSRP
jgi:hypothetical protein